MLQSCLLDQIRIVTANQNLVMWVSPSLSINIHSSESCLLQQHTEVVVCLSQDKQEKVFNGLEYIDPPRTTVKNPQNKPHAYHITDVNKILSKYDTESSEKQSCMRAIVINKAFEKKLKNILKPSQQFFVYIKEGTSGYQENHIYNLRCMDSIVVKEDNQENANAIPKSVYVKVKFMPKTVLLKELDADIKYIPIIIPKSLSDLLNIDLGRKIIMTSVPQTRTLPKTIEVTLVEKDVFIDLDDILSLFQIYVSQFTEVEPLLLNNGSIINLSPLENISLQVTLFPETLKYTLVCGASLSSCKVYVNKETVQPYVNIASTKQYIADVEDISRNVESFESIVKKSVDVIKCNTHLKENLSGQNYCGSNKNHIFITGEFYLIFCNLFVEIILNYNDLKHCHNLASFWHDAIL